MEARNGYLFLLLLMFSKALLAKELAELQAMIRRKDPKPPSPLQTAHSMYSRSGSGLPHRGPMQPGTLQSPESEKVAESSGK